MPSIGQIPQGIISPVTFSGTVTSPGVPGSGSNYWITKLNTTTGVLSVKTSTSATHRQTPATSPCSLRPFPAPHRRQSLSKAISSSPGSGP